MIYNSFSQLIGNTPMLRLLGMEKSLKLESRLYAKLEYFNPAGSVKDRVGLNMLDEGEKSGKINKDTVIIEPTSGNTGIGLAAVAASRGYKTVIVMPENMSEERKKLVKAYGASLVLTDACLGMAGAIKKAEEIQKTTPNSVVAGQFVNPANPDAHYKTTGPEIYRDLKDIDYFVCGVGTGGTLTGTARYLKEQNKSIKAVAVEPKSSAVLSGEGAGAHGLQGIGAGFVPEILDASLIDEIFTVTEEQAYAAARALSKTEGVLAGISSGAALHAATEIALREKNKNIVVLLPDTGERYLSTELY